MNSLSESQIFVLRNLARGRPAGDRVETRYGGLHRTLQTLLGYGYVEMIERRVPLKGKSGAFDRAKDYVLTAAGKEVVTICGLVPRLLLPKPKVAVKYGTCSKCGRRFAVYRARVSGDWAIRRHVRERGGGTLFTEPCRGSGLAPSSPVSPARYP